MNSGNVFEMMRAFFVGMVLLAGLTAGRAASAAGDYDNPTLGIAPCVVLNSYAATRTSKRKAEDPRYAARAAVENICGRTLELSFCFLYAEEVDGNNRHCVDEMIRPGSGTKVSHEGVPVRVTAPEYRWRYLPVQ